MCWWEFGDGDIRSCFVCFEGFIGAVFALVSEGEFSEVAVVIPLPTNKWCPTEQILTNEDIREKGYGNRRE